MDKFTNGVIQFFTSRKLIISVVIIVVALILYGIIKRMINKASERKVKDETINKKRKTYLRLFNSALKYVVILIVVVLILQVYGINVTSIIAGLGVVSVIAGLALQDALKDVNKLLGTENLNFFQKILQKAALLINCGNEHATYYRSGNKFMNT